MWTEPDTNLPTPLQEGQMHKHDVQFHEEKPFLVEEVRGLISTGLPAADSGGALAKDCDPPGMWVHGQDKRHSAGHVGDREFVAALPSGSTLSEPDCPEVTTGKAAAEGAPRRVLIVDDNIDSAQSLGELLRAFGHNVNIAYDGASAISDATRLQPDVVILDIGLPRMNGYEVAQQLRSRVGLTATVLVALTGYAQERDRINAQEAGFDHYFAKPLDIDRLADVLGGIK
jgi:CheY-like chemotaxis protein